MDSTAHSTNAFLMYHLLHFLIWGSLAPPIYGFFTLILGILPDFDGIYFALKGKDPRDNTFQHHMYFGSHWPITYTPLLIFLIFSFIFNFYPEIFLMINVGIYMHLICDSACCGDGMMWGKTYNKKKFDFS